MQKAVLRFNSLAGLTQVLLLLPCLFLSGFSLNPGNWANFALYGFGEIYGGQTGIMAGASLMFFAFLGFESISMAVDEIRNHKERSSLALSLVF